MSICLLFKSSVFVSDIQVYEESVARQDQSQHSEGGGAAVQPGAR